jgi:putative salt-induced outer membrane protein
MKFLQSLLLFIVSAVAALGQAALVAPATPPATNLYPWDASAALGLTLTRGNSRTVLINGDIQANKKWDLGKNELKLGANGTYGENNGIENNEQLRGYGQFNRLITERLFGYFRLEGLHDGIAKVDYRLTVSPGAGYYILKNTSTSLSAEVGPGFIYEKLAGRTRDYFTLRLAERFDQKLGEHAKLWQSVEILPQVDDFSNYLINSEIGIDTAITKHLSQRTFIQDTFHSRPAPGREKNDIKLVAAIAYKF